MKLANFDTITYENQLLGTFLKKQMPLFNKVPTKLHYLTNGIDFRSFSNYNYKSIQKENIILHVARIRSEKKEVIWYYRPSPL